jgi:hypothetical protein
MVSLLCSNELLLPYCLSSESRKTCQVKTFSDWFSTVLHPVSLTLYYILWSLPSLYTTRVPFRHLHRSN